MKRTLVFLLSLIPFVATAGIFKCVVDGKTTFSQRPCGDDAQEIEVKYRAASVDPGAHQTQGQPSYHGSMKADQVIRDRKTRAKQAEIKKYQQQMDKELAALRHKKGMQQTTWLGRLGRKVSRPKCRLLQNGTDRRLLLLGRSLLGLGGNTESYFYAINTHLVQSIIVHILALSGYINIRKLKNWG